MALKINDQIRYWLVERGNEFDIPEDDARAAVADAVETGSLDPKELADMFQVDRVERRKALVDDIAGAVSKKLKNRKDSNMTPTNMTPSAIYASGSGYGGSIRVKAGSEGYSVTKAIGMHTRMGTPIADAQGKPLELPSEMEYAKAGAMLKHLAMKAGMPIQLTDHDRQLWDETLTKDVWCGQAGGEWHHEIEGLKVKSLISDSLSGGLGLNPIWYDQALITFPLLNGELLPLVTLRDVPRSSRVEGASIGNPTLTWGIEDATEIGLFDTDALAVEIDTTIHAVTVAVEVGRDLLNDSPADVGMYITQNIGQAMAKELDKVIAIGNGSTQPAGLFGSAGITVVPTTNNTAGPPAPEDYEGLLFGLPKQYRRGNSVAFVGNDVTYARARGIRLDPHVPGTTINQSRFFGNQTYQDYQLCGVTYRVQQDIPNTQVGCGDLSRYRLYRRLGMSMEWTVQGESLMRRNMALLIVRGRFGGKLMDSNAFVEATTAQT